MCGGKSDIGTRQAEGGNALVMRAGRGGRVGVVRQGALTTTTKRCEADLRGQGIKKQEEAVCKARR